jgi:hypothetical protein
MGELADVLRDSSAVWIAMLFLAVFMGATLLLAGRQDDEDF